MRLVFVILVCIGMLACKNDGGGTSSNLDLSGDTLFIQPPAYIVCLNAMEKSKSDTIPGRLIESVKRTFGDIRNDLDQQGATAIMGSFSHVAILTKPKEIESVLDMVNSGGFAVACPKEGKPFIYDMPMDALVIKKDVLGLSAEDIQEEKAKLLKQQ
jgi:hypothetical protein